MATDRTVSATWNGSLLDGSGTIHAAGSGAFGPLAVSWASRAEEPNGQTSPEELIAAAHSACFAMALAHGLAQSGTPAERLDTSATVTFQPGEGIIRIALTVRGTVPASMPRRSLQRPRRREPGARSRRRSPLSPRSRSTRRWPDRLDG